MTKKEISLEAQSYEDTEALDYDDLVMRFRGLSSQIVARLNDLVQDGNLHKVGSGMAAEIFRSGDLSDQSLLFNNEGRWTIRSNFMLDPLSEEADLEEVLLAYADVADPDFQNLLMKKTEDMAIFHYNWVHIVGESMDRKIAARDSGEEIVLTDEEESDLQAFYSEQDKKEAQWDEVERIFIDNNKGELLLGLLHHMEQTIKDLETPE